MKHLLDWGTTKCSCRWWGCKICNANNKVISLHNDLMKFWASKELIKENLKEINKYVDKVDSFSLYEYLTEQMDQEAFEQALQQYSPKKKRNVAPKKSEVDWFVPSVNPERMCVFKDNSPRARCTFCNSIKKYMKDKECPRFKDNLE